MSNPAFNTHAPGGFEWSAEQNHIFNEILASPTSSFIVDACAGASKTTTLVELVNRIVASGVPAPQIQCLSFNKKIAETLAERMPPGVRSSTMNALGHSALRSTLPVSRLNVDAWKEANLWRNFVPAFKALDKSEQKAIVDAYTGVKTSGLTLAPSELDWELCSHYEDFNPEFVTKRKLNPVADSSPAERFMRHLESNTMELDPRDWVESFRQVFSLDLYASLAHGSISFLDQLYLSAVMTQASLPAYPHVLIDEAQDLGPLEHRILTKVVSRFPKGRLIGVGDRAQAIYAFKGAHYDSLDRLGDTFKASWLSLPVSYRCPQEVVKEAQLLDDRIQVWDKAPEGRVEILTKWSYAGLERPSTILCRVNYPLVSAALSLIQQGIGAKFLGRDFETNLTNFFDSWRKKSQILTGMFLAIDQEIKKLEDKGDKYKANRLYDNVECLRAIADQYQAQDFDDLKRGITTLFNSPGPITLASIHKAKGLEWPHVYLIRPDLLPHPNATSPEELIQENNMQYVAVTRAQESFTYLPKQER